jgi:hypothetical protein
MGEIIRHNSLSVPRPSRDERAVRVSCMARVQRKPGTGQ